MKIKVTTSLSGDGFAYQFGQVVDENEFKNKVGAGWEALCEPVSDGKTAAGKKGAEKATDVRAEKRETR